MAPHASSVVTMSSAREPEQFPVSPRPAPADSPAATQQAGRLRPLEVAQCSLCGIALPMGLLVPDGGDACADVRWYCKDAKSCTERWTAARLPGHARRPAPPGTAFARAGEPALDGVSADRRDGVSKKAAPGT